MRSLADIKEHASELLRCRRRASPYGASSRLKQRGLALVACLAVSYCATMKDGMAQLAFPADPVGSSGLTVGMPKKSPYELKLDPAFGWPVVQLDKLPEDCETNPEAQSVFNKYKEEGHSVREVSSAFLQFAYSGNYGGDMKIANVSSVAVADLGGGEYRVFVGSSLLTHAYEPKPNYCGFKDIHIVDSEWANAGFSMQPIVVQLAELPANEQEILKLRSAYRGMDYSRVRSSLQKRGFEPINIKESITAPVRAGLGKRV